MTTGAISRAQLQSKCHHQQTNTQFLTGRMPFLSPNQQRQSTEPILDLIGANEVVSGDNWSYKTCKDPVKMSPPTNQHEVSFYRPDVLPVAQPSASEH